MIFRILIMLVAFGGASALAIADQVRAPGIDVASVSHDLEIVEGVEWCRASPGASRDFIEEGGCERRPLTRRERNLGFIEDVVWLRLPLRNSSVQDLEPWLQVGHPRLTKITIFQKDAAGRWMSERTGYGVPRSQRSSIGKYYDVTPVRVAAGATSDVWVRIESKARVTLELRLWESHAYRGFRQAATAWVAASSGALLFGLVLSLMMWGASSQSQYGFLALSLLGQFVLSLILSGVLLRLFWPDDLPVPIELVSVGGMLVATGFVGYVYTAVPALKKMLEERLAVRALAFGVVAFQTLSIFGDYRLGLTVWTALSVPLGALMAWVAYEAWRQGDAFAIWVSVAFVAVSVFMALGTPAAKINAPEYVLDLIAAPALMLVVVALVLFAAIENPRALQRQLTDAELAKQGQVQFLSRMSHELRTPLDSMVPNAQLLMHSSEQLRDKRELTGIVSSGQQLMGTMDEILDYVRGNADASTLQPVPTVLGDFLRRIEFESKALAEKNGNQFVLDLQTDHPSIQSAVLKVDANRLRRALDHLITNAVRHTRNGIISLACGLHQRNADNYELTFAVRDSGEGIAADDLQRIFQPFERVGRAERYGGKGAGLGLAIVKQFVNLMGGEVSVESTSGKGSVFRFSIPVDGARFGAAAESFIELRAIDAQGYAGRQRVVVVIDDDPGGRALVAELLGRMGFVVHEAESGNSAIDEV